MRQTFLGLVVTVSLLSSNGTLHAQFNPQFPGNPNMMGGQIDPGFLNSPPGPTAFRPDQVPHLARLLDDEARQFVPAIYRELGGTPQGRQLVIRGNGLASAAEGYARTLQPGGDPGQQGIWRDQFGQALDAVQAELNNPPGTAPVATAICQRLGRLVYEINRAMGGGPQPGVPPGGGFLPPGMGGPSQQVMQLVQTASSQLNATNGFLATDVGQVPPFDGVMLDIQALLVGLQQINQLALSGSPPGQLRSTLLQLWPRVRQINAMMQNGSPALNRARASWNAAVVPLSALAQLVGVPPDLSSPPTIGPGPGPGFPNPGLPNPGAGQPTIFMAAQLLGEVEGFLAAVQPTALRIPQGLQFLADARSLRGVVIGFRQAAVSGAPPGQLQAMFGQVEQAYSVLLNRINRIAGFRSGPNIDRVRRMGGLVDQIRASIGM